MKSIMLAALINMYPIFCSESVISQHYVCLAISKTSYTYGWGKDEKEARLNALFDCAKSTPTGWLCEIEYCDENRGKE
jgi:hypothetical protein